MTARRQALLVLGMHRSGTSAMAGTLVKCGATPPGTLVEGNPDNPRGFFESAPIMDFHDALLKSAGSHWNDWRALDPAWYHRLEAAQFSARARQLLDHEFADCGLFVLKDPRICRFVPFWRDVFRTARITARCVLIARLPLEAAQSLSQRETIPLVQCLLLWLRHALDAEGATRGMPRAFVLYESLLQDWRAQIARVSSQAQIAWPGGAPSGEADVDAFLDPALRRQSAPSEDCRLHPSMQALITQTYEAHVALTRDPASPEACAALDRVRLRFDDASGLFGPLYARHVDGELYGLRIENRHARDEARGLRAQVHDLHARAQALEESAHDLAAQVHDLSAALDAQQRRTRAEAEMSGTLAAELARERSEARWLRVTLRAKSRAVASAASEIATLHAAGEAERAALQGIHADLQAARRDVELARLTLAQTQARLGAMEASTSWRMTRPLRWALQRNLRLRRVARRMFRLPREEP